MKLETLVCAHCHVVLSNGGHRQSFPTRENVSESKLTRRERLVYTLLCNGLSNKQMATQLVISENTVRYHLKALYSKLGVSSRIQAMALSNAASLRLAMSA